MILKRGWHKIRGLKLFLDNTFVEKNFRFQRNKLKDGGNEILFSPKSVFHERVKRRFIPFLKKKSRTLIIFPEDGYRALEFTEDKKELKLNPYWTMAEAEEWVNRTVAKKLAELKPISQTQFIILFLLLLVSIGLGVFNLMGVRM